MNLKEIKELIELISEKGFAEFEIERQGFRLRINRFAPLPAQVTPPPSSQPSASNPSPSHSDTPAYVARFDRRSTDQAAHSSPQSAPEREPIVPEVSLHTIKSPIVGTFYRASSPDSEPFVKIGDNVDVDSVVCIIEAMKLMNEIQAEVTGEVVKIFVENGQAVEYGQPLFGIKT
ncbi:MAG TPA: acetyl-CoA carboxylase biotin carboxyl carrier protein [Blastocatellia bacterium]|jgi:acetyl-CoA carboxylase biotin carboxyl carrier protein|nr:acetyl-CoA carboxylase biotin carboxyl carrier protein [Blastocatellia bacterium]